MALSIMDYAIVFFVILIIGAIGIFIQKRRMDKKKAGMPVMVIQPDALGNSNPILLLY